MLQVSPLLWGLVQALQVSPEDLSHAGGMVNVIPLSLCEYVGDWEFSLEERIARLFKLHMLHMCHDKSCFHRSIGLKTENCEQWM